MGKSHPRYAPCASSTQLLTDCRVRRLGDLVELVGHPQMLFTPQDALFLISVIQSVVEDILNDRERHRDPA